MRVSFSSFINNRTIIFIYAVLAIAATAQSVLISKKVYHEGGKIYTHYNNYVIFKQSYFHLREGKDLYQLYPEEHWDLYKYSPSFALCFGVLSNLPDALGLGFWNFINAFALLAGIFFLPKLNPKHRIYMLAIIAPELVISMQHAENNALIAGLIILALGFLERKNYLIATLFIVITVYIKLFGIVAIALFLFYPNKWKLAAYTLLWSLLLFALPLVVISAEQLKFLYSSWANLLLNDHSESYGYSVMGWLHSWFNMDINKLAVMLTGAVVFLLPYIKTGFYKNYTFRQLALASVLVWVVIFNHKAESPSFVIAMSGIVVWFFAQSQSRTNIVLMFIAFIGVSLLPTDLVPRTFKREFLEPYVIKAIPCIIIWPKIIYDMIRPEKHPAIEQDKEHIET